MEDTRYCIRPDLQEQDYENLSRLHEKYSKGAMSVVNRVSNILLLILGIVLPAEAVILFFLQRRVSSTSLLALFVGLIAIAYLCFRRKLFARMTKKQNEKLAGNMEIVVDDAGLHARNASVSSDFAFSAIEAVYCWRDCYFLYLDRLRLQLLPFRGFTEGDPVQFAAYLEEKTGLTVQKLNDQLKKES